MIGSGKFQPPKASAKRGNSKRNQKKCPGFHRGANQHELSRLYQSNRFMQS